MKRFLTIIASILVSVAVFAQTPTNYKEGDFTGKQLKAKSIKLDANWLIEKGSTGTITWKYNGTSVMTITSAGTMTPTAESTGNLAITGTLTTGSNVADTASFATTAVRKAVYIAGATATDMYFISPKNKSSAANAYIVAGDICNWFAKTDSLIVTRQAGTTSALTFSWLRIK